MTPPSDTLIIGGGVIGASAAYYLARRGRPVTLLEAGEIAAGSSFGNAGLIVPSHATPLAAPGALAQGLAWMLDPESPFYIRPRLDWDLLAWVVRFGLAANHAAVRRAIPVLRDLGMASRVLFDDLAGRFDFEYQAEGLLLLYKTAAGFRSGLEEMRLLQSFDIPVEAWEGDRVRQRLPSVRPGVVGALYFPRDAQLDPAGFTRGLARLAEQAGARILTQTPVQALRTDDRRVIAALTPQGEFPADQFILAAGAWSPAVVRSLQLNLPIQPAKGYSLTVRRPDLCPDLPLLLGETRVAVTPYAATLRLAGTLEMAGMNQEINPRRVEAIRRGARAFLTGLEQLDELELWRGLRPCSPDGLPIIGRARPDNLIIAGGHAMMGMTYGPITGELVAQLACGEQPELDLRPYRPERFA